MRQVARVLSLTALTLGLTAPAASACGGFFCRNVPIDQAGEKIVFGVDEQKEEIFAVIQIQYQGAAEDFSWIVPVPSTPSVGVSSDEIFSKLGPPTIPQFRLDYKVEGTCKVEDAKNFLAAPSAARGGVPGSAGESVADSGVTVISREKVGPFDATVLLPTDPAALEKWLKTENYRVPDRFTELSSSYIEKKHYFVALKLLKDKDAGDLRPVVLKMKERYPCVPIRLTAIAAKENMPIILWVFGRARAIPTNYLHVHLNEALIDWVGASPRWGGGFLGGPIGLPFRGGGGAPAPNYDAVVTQSMAEAGGNGFVTEYATSSAAVKGVLTHNYDTQKLAGLTAPGQFMQEVARQGYPRSGLMQNIFRKYLPLPQDLKDRGTDEMTWWNSLFFGSGQFQTKVSDFARFSATAFADEIYQTFVKPIDEAKALLENTPYMTRMYTTMTVEAMAKLDPLFAFNSKLPDVDNVHVASADILCNSDIYEWQAPYRITLKNGTQFTIKPDQQNTYKPLPLAAMPAAFRIEKLAEEGDTLLTRDNRPKIEEAIKNIAPPITGPGGSGGTAANGGSGGGPIVSIGPGCACAQLPTTKNRIVDTSAADKEGLFWGLALGALVGVRRLRRRK
jgi:hypothetical protein